MTTKQQHGQYFTTNNPFKLKIVKLLLSLHKNETILEPFAGSNNLIYMLRSIGVENPFKSYDIEPKNKNVEYRDTLANFPTGYNLCITNPPYLAKNSATKKGLKCEFGEYDDLYKYALKKCLDNCETVFAIIPASFLNTNLFRDRLYQYILLNDKMFDDTEHPVCLAIFTREHTFTAVYEKHNFIGFLDELESFHHFVDVNKMGNYLINNDFVDANKIGNNHYANAGKIGNCLINNQFVDVNKMGKIVKFNAPNGNLGLVAIDNTKEASIKFCRGDEIDSSKVLSGSRSITRIQVETSDLDKLISDLNEALHKYRVNTHDIFLTPFKGIRKDGKFRRRLDFKLAKKLINSVL